jgi:DNA-binding response OmpR family regulator
VSVPTVLVVDDDADARRYLGIRLTASGYATVSAGDGAAALAIARRDKPDVVLLDLGLPDADGLAVLRSLRSDPATAGIPVIVMTVSAPTVDRARALAAGATDFFQKPADNGALLASIATAIAGAAAGHA